MTPDATTDPALAPTEPSLAQLGSALAAVTSEPTAATGSRGEPVSISIGPTRARAESTLPPVGPTLPRAHSSWQRSQSPAPILFTPTAGSGEASPAASEEEAVAPAVAPTHEEAPETQPRVPTQGVAGASGRPPGPEGMPTALDSYEWPASQGPDELPPRAAPRGNATHDPKRLELPKVDPVPDAPKTGLLAPLEYTVAVLRARWQRRSATKELASANDRAKAELDETLTALGKETRARGVEDPRLEAENRALDAAYERREEIELGCDELSNQKVQEDNEFAETEDEVRKQLGRLESERDALDRELAEMEARRRGIQEKLGTIARQQRGYLEGAEQREEQAGQAPMGETRSGLRRAAEELRRDAQALEAEKVELERRSLEFERPRSRALASKEALEAQIDDARRNLDDARSAHRHRVQELEAEHNERTRELSQTDTEITRHLTSLGSLVNLHRIERPELAPFYARIDELRSAMGARSNAIDRLEVESESYDHDSYKRGLLMLAGGALVVVVILVLLFRAC